MCKVWLKSSIVLRLLILIIYNVFTVGRSYIIETNKHNNYLSYKLEKIGTNNLRSRERTGFLIYIYIYIYIIN